VATRTSMSRRPGQAAACKAMRAAFSPIMIEGALVLPEVSVEQLLVRIHPRTRRKFFGAEPGQGRRGDQPPHDAHAGEHTIAVGAL
jgi:hypothetical protein